MEYPAPQIAGTNPVELAEPNWKQAQILDPYPILLGPLSSSIQKDQDPFSSLQMGEHATEI